MLNGRIVNLNELMETLKPYLRDYLEKMGTPFSNGKFRCPNYQNHSNGDETPSASFNPHFPGESVWHCFACEDADGDIFKTAHLLEGKPKDGKDFIAENVVYLAKMFQIPYETEELSPEEQLRRESFRALTWAMDMAHKTLWKSSAITYVRQRKWSDEAISEFKLGYVVYSKLYELLEKEGFSVEVLKNAGVANEELFNSRLVFPVRDAKGNVRGFAGRSLLSKEEQESKGIQKYYNSKVSLLYKKSELLFNLHTIKSDTVLVVEGYADTVTFWDRGIKNVVGLGGVELTEDHLKSLNRQGVKTIILCLDNDEVGRAKEEKILEQIKRRHGLNVRVKMRDECEDPDTCLQQHDFLLSSPDIPLFEYRLQQYKKSEDKGDRDKLLKSICLERSPIDRARLCKLTSKELGIRVEAVHEEVDFLLARGGNEDLLDENELTKEAQQSELDLKAFESQAQQGAKRGLLTGFPILDERVRGIKNMFWIIAGEEQTGKSAFQRALMLGLLKNNPGKVYCLYFSLDDSKDKVFSRLMASEAGLEINAMEDPKGEIEQNADLSAEQKAIMLRKRSDVYQSLLTVSSGFTIKDDSNTGSIVEMESTIRKFKKLAGDRQLVVFVDSLHCINPAPTFKETTREQFMRISKELKKWCTVYDVPVIATAELRKLSSGDNKHRRPVLDDIKEAGDFKFDAEVILLSYNEMKAKGREGLAAALKFEYPNEGSGTWFPIVEMFVGKNKASSYRGCLYYKFLDPCARVYECSKSEQVYFWNRAFNDVDD